MNHLYYTNLCKIEMYKCVNYLQYYAVFSVTVQIFVKHLLSSFLDLDPFLTVPIVMVQVFTNGMSCETDPWIGISMFMMMSKVKCPVTWGSAGHYRYFPG